MDTLAYRIVIHLIGGSEVIWSGEPEPMTFGEADYLHDMVIGGQYWEAKDVKYASVQVNCPEHGWSPATWGSCDLCRDEITEAEYEEYAVDY
jgi:hypothetical protein